jgi:trimeric autotransporter adhesin
MMTSKKCFLFNFLFFVIIQLSAQIPQNGLIGKWYFDGNANDASGKGNNGTVTGASLSVDRFGIANKCYYFDGNDYIDLGCSNSSLSPDRFTVALWFKLPKNADGQRRTLIRNRMYGYTIWTQDNNIIADIHDGPVLKVLRYTTPSTKNDDVWHHIAITADEKDYKVYFDSVLVKSESTGFNCYYTDRCVTFGVDANSGNFNLIGHLDDILIYNKTLNHKQIDSLFVDGKKKSEVLIQTLINSNIDVTVFPNPSVGEYNLLSSKNITSVKVINSLGENIMEINDNLHANNYNIDLSAMPDGTYSLQVLLECGMIVNKRIVKISNL